ncbi:MAG: hypothetical protein EKE20_17555 [Candidatus Symbiopectobacterium sp. Dall1.0]|nr:hypothetical protein [Candidatus Symbiopectobacterium sp. Dall1.0]
MMNITTDNLDALLFHEMMAKFDEIKHLGCSGNTVVHEQRIIHYSRTGKHPDFSSKGFHWTSHLATNVYYAYENTGMSYHYTDLFLIKIGYSEALNRYDPQGRKSSPIKATNHTGVFGMEFALDINDKWLSKYGIKLPLPSDYLGHIKIQVTESGEFIPVKNDRL